ncbi:tRNA (uridine(54)-C5)-methyltransferase TrmA [Amphritea balenae]|uniref:tRNA/tmRNA (uracil-C(5))-methyltransferase n=1 Tax=Amphritea balenae TaxID=452629 RepID=A0A3P1STH6_9GAMM|nr:tRNA (uridine(54)-C5)-methyltransferase TrmA [Amphritea balenae]RRD00380.1 tRNA (uridine(54)-C5)-methyltransferase TrmA [Amphritea balenae]GGK85930.1 tRNA/tmRNA (uracil-C(5))-methyltransferase [Amphritea balenae]
MALPVVDPSQYDAQLNSKKTEIEQQFDAFALPDIEVFESVKTAYRLRAEFRVWHEGDDLYYVMFKPGDKHQHSRLEACPMVSETIQQVMFKLLDYVRPNELLRRRLFQVDFLSTLSGELIISLLYHKPLDEAWTKEAKKLKQHFGIHFIGRSRKTKIVLDQDFAIEKMQVSGRELIYKQVENSFTQPNGGVCQQMLEWAQNITTDASGDLVELYCGNGNFTMALAQNFDRVIATEIAKVSVNAAQYNIEANKVDNVKILRMSSEEFSQALQGVREFRRLKQSAVDLTEYNFSTVLVDPPRSGLDDETVKQVAEYDNIIYISCNPDTLQDNLQQLTKTHTLQRFAIFDQFPYTHHLECGVYLTRR